MSLCQNAATDFLIWENSLATDTNFIFMATSSKQNWVNHVKEGNMDAANLPCSNYWGTTSIRGATQKFPKFECRAKTACSTVVGL
jgi:hypothetical protein